MERKTAPDGERSRNTYARSCGGGRNLTTAVTLAASAIARRECYAILNLSYLFVRLKIFFGHPFNSEVAHDPVATRTPHFVVLSLWHRIDSLHGFTQPIGSSFLDRPISPDIYI